MSISSRTSLLVLAVVLAGCRAEEAPPVPVSVPEGTVLLDEAQEANAGLETRVARATDIHVARTFPATLAPPDTEMSEVGSIVEGRVERVMVVEGTRVRRGQVLAYLHSHELTAAVRDLAAAESRWTYAKSSLDRSLRLLEAGAVSREEVERREAEAGAASAERERAAAMVDHLDPSPNGEVTVRAPRDGVVLGVHTHPSQAVTPGAPLFSVGPEGTLWATAFVPERDAVRLLPETAAVIRLRALPDSAVAGHVVAVGRQVDPDSRTVAVRVALDVVPQGIRSGMFVSVELRDEAPVHGVPLPVASVQRLNGQDMVFLAEGSRLYRPVPVRASLSGDGQMVVDGIEDGAQVVVAGAYLLKATMEQAVVAEEDE